MSGRILEANAPLPAAPMAATAADIDSLLAQIGANVERIPTALYALSGVTIRRGVNAFNVNTFIGAGGIPAIGVVVVNLFPNGNGDEPQATDGSGVARFQYAASSAFTDPGSGPFTVFATDQATKDSDAIPKVVHYGAILSDKIHSLGDFQGTHTEIYLQFVERPTAPPPPSIPVVRTDDELRNLAYATINAQRNAVSYNPSAALSRVARAIPLGIAMASEWRYLDAVGVRWAWQPFALGIMRCVEGDWAHAEAVRW